MKISKLGIIEGFNCILRFTAILLVLTFIAITLFDAPITLEDMFLKNPIYPLFVIIEFTLGYKKGSKIEARQAKDGETSDEKRTGTNS